jgi:hypothetical protein
MTAHDGSINVKINEIVKVILKGSVVLLSTGSQNSTLSQSDKF